MLEKCQTGLLISDVPSFCSMYQKLANSIGVTLNYEDKWDKMYRLNSDVIILGTKYIEAVNASYYPKTVVILKEGESPAPYISKGISHFIFDHTNKYELICALFRLKTVTVHRTSNDIEESIRASGCTIYNIGDYNFDFGKNRFLYKGKAIYLCTSQKAYLAEWLLNANKDNAKRTILYNMRHKFGKDFLRDIDRFGQLRGGKNNE